MIMRWLGRSLVWLTTQYLEDYRTNRSRILNAISRNNLHLNTIILTVSIASLTATAALSREVFIDYPILSIIVLGLFIMVILLSTINFFLSGLVLSDLNKSYSKDILLPLKIGKGEYSAKYQPAQRLLNALVLAGFCLGLITLLALLVLHILGVEA